MTRTRPTIIAFDWHVQKLVPSKNESWDLYRWERNSWQFFDNVGQSTFEQIVDEAEELSEVIDQVGELRSDLAEVHSELVLAPPPVCDALDDLISIVELMPEAQDPSTDLWASLFTARESLRSATLSEPKVPE
jgi:hypothetical protein